jgi:phosphatidylglycerol:prolipoprotein diacylglycerol transferase
LETVHGIVPGSGPVAVTTQIRGINPGEWIVTARPVARAAGGLARLYPSRHAGRPDGQRWPLRPRRVVISAGARAAVRTAPQSLAKVPGIVRPAYAGLISLGVLAGLGLQTVLPGLARFPAGRALMFSVLAVAAGLAGGKAWYIALHRGRRFDGWCIQGFITGAAAVAAAAPIAGLGIPAGGYLSAAAPALLIGMAIGRRGCFWAGCCVGRPTASPWGIWSSDRRVGCRRIPAQLLEALLSLLIGLAVLAAVLALGLAQSGLVALAAVAACTPGRQFIVRLRADPPRRAPYGGPVTGATAAAVLMVSAAVLAWQEIRDVRRAMLLLTLSAQIERVRRVCRTG